MIIHLDYSTGASGDKTLGALLEVSESLGLASFAELQAVIARLLPTADVHITREKVTRGSTTATSLVVKEISPPIRRWSDLRNLLESSKASNILDTYTLTKSLKIFEAIAAAEATVHGVPLDDVHFHEIGAADSIVDIVGCCWLLKRLGEPLVYATPLSLGAGTVSFSHGTLPVPAPATARLIVGLPVAAGLPGEPGELTTPTGAALARVLVDRFEPLPLMQVTAIGYGAGMRKLAGQANVTRALMGEPASPLSAAKESPLPQHLRVEQIVLLETNIDHRSPESLAFACEELLAAGALDVWQEPITMKKGRAAVCLNVLAAAYDAQRIAAEIIAQTGSLGVRSSLVERVVAEHRSVVLATPYGEVPFKSALLRAKSEAPAWLRPEHDAVAHLARAQNLDYQKLYDELIALANNRNQ